MATRSRFSLPRDTGLQVRMVVTMLLLGALYVAFVGGLIAAGTGAVTMLVIAGGLALAQLFLSDKIALRAMGAKVTTPEQAPELHAMIERLCLQADLPKPQVAVADTSVPNAFALGRSQDKATVCATTGLMRTLNAAELEGVMAHELAHVKHRDVMVMTIASFFATVAAMIAQWGLFFSGGGRSREGVGAFVLMLAASYAVYVISYFLMLALSRYREFSADRGAALITGRPAALSSALMRISGAMERVPERDLRAAGEMNAFFIVPAGLKSTAKSLFSTHPPMEQRIARLQELERSMQGGAAA